MKTRSEQKIKGLSSVVAALSALTVLILGMGQACSSSLPNDTSSAAVTSVSSPITNGTPTSLALVPSLQTIAYGATLQFSGSGGTPPYSYYVASGTGSIDAASGLYTAVSAAATVSIGIQDAVGAKAYAVVMVASSTSSTTLTGGSYSQVMSTSFTQLGAYNSICSQLEPYGDGCNLAIQQFCQASGYGTGFGPVEYSGDQALVTCMIKGSTTLSQVAYIGLAAYQPSCNATVPLSDLCISAQSRYCQAAGYVSGFGPITHDANNATTECVTSNADTMVTLQFSVLTAQNSSCVDANSVSGACMAATHQYCMQQGYVSGYGPVEHGGGLATINCVR